MKDKKFLLYLGCTIPTKQYAYEISVRAVLPKLGIELVEFEGASCCGFPLKGIDRKAWIYMSARVLALARQYKLPILVLCNGCDVSLRETKHFLDKYPELKNEISEMLREEGLELNNNVNIVHTIEILHDVIGVEKIKASIVKPLSNLKIASYPGCHALRPTEIPRPEDAVNPVKIDNIIRALGAETEDYPDKRGCCGATMLPYSPESAIKTSAAKIRIMKDYGFDAAVTSCPYCMEMLDVKQDVAKNLLEDEEISLPIFYLTQLVGLSMGLKPEELGLNLNMSPVEDILERLEV